MSAPATASTQPAQVMKGTDVLKVLSRRRTDEVAVLSESTRQDWPPISTHPELDIPITGSMSKASSFGLGLALARPDVRVWVLDTDGALLMNLGSLVTIAAAKPGNLVHFLYDNGAYDTTGGQPTPGAGMVNFQEMALSAGYPRACTYTRLEDFERDLDSVLSGVLPALVVLKIASEGRRTHWTMGRMPDQFATLQHQLAQRPAK
jgi:thiamine pyrophosphate-dependent acetolactate synthase large subunit-like protein